MRFNPPPNWPQPPAGWTPPPGWEPDPSWPQPPPGWQVWLDEDEFIISPHRATASSASSVYWTPSAQSTQPWHRRTVSVVLLLIFLFPVGLVLLWMRRDWSVQRRALISAVVGVFVIIALAGQSSPPPATTTALSPTAGATASSSSPTPSATPSPVVTTTSPAPATTAPPKTSAAAVIPVHTTAAPVRTTAAPVHTTQAPQPVQTTAAQQSCTPLTNGGKCYEPGEFCRSSDHGVTGIAGDGKTIKCEDNDGWRWEPV